MPGYIPKVLEKFQHTRPSQPQHSPYWTPNYSPTRPNQRQFVPDPDTSARLDPQLTTRVQSIVGSLLYYGRAVDNSILPALNTISAHQSCPTQNTLARCHHLLDFVASHPHTFLRFYSSDMQLTIDSDAAYLVAPLARSRIAGFFQLNSSSSFVNGAHLVECRTLKHVVASSAEAEAAGLFYNAQVALPIRYMLEQLGHPQSPSPIKTDNSTANAFVHNNLTQKKSKSWDMRYYWLRDKEAQGAFRPYWDKGTNNHADYFTKHHTAKMHRTVRPRYVSDRSP